MSAVLIELLPKFKLKLELKNPCHHESYQSWTRVSQSTCLIPWTTCQLLVTCSLKNESVMWCDIRRDSHTAHSHIQPASSSGSYKLGTWWVQQLYPDSSWLCQPTGYICMESYLVYLATLSSSFSCISRLSSIFQPQVIKWKVGLRVSMSPVVQPQHKKWWLL